MPFWVKDDKPDLQLRPARLWEYLVDCTQWQAHKPTLDVAHEWVKKSFELLCKEGPKPQKTTLWLHKLLTGSITINQLPNVLAIEPKQFKEAVEKKLDAALLLEEHKELLNAVANLLLQQFPFWNTLALPAENGGSFRNANNVTALARKDETWFISQYESRRLSKLSKNQNEITFQEIVDLMMNLPIDQTSPLKRVWRIQAPAFERVEVRFASIVINQWLQEFGRFRGRLAEDIQNEMRQALWRFAGEKGEWPDRQDYWGKKT